MSILSHFIFFRTKSHNRAERSTKRDAAGVTHLDDLGGALADGVQQRLLDALEVDAVEQQVDGLHGLAVDGQVCCRRPGVARCGPCSRRS